MIKIENFDKYIQKKHINIESRIFKKQNKLEKLKQIGAGKEELAKIQLDLAYLEQLKNILKAKTKTSDKIDFELISEPLAKLVEELELLSKVVNEELETSVGELNLSQLLNQIETVQKFITNGKDNYLDIKLKKMPALVHPPIAIPAIDDSYREIFDFIDKNLSELIKAIKSKELEESKDLKEKILKLRSQLENLETKTESLKESSQLLKDKIKEITDYTEMSLDDTDLDSKYFFPIELAQNEMISVDKLDDKVSDLEPNEDIRGISEKFDEIIKAPPAEGIYLIKPNLLEIARQNQQQSLSRSSSQTSLLGGKNIYLYSNQNVKTVVNEIYSRWMDQIQKIYQDILTQKTKVSSKTSQSKRDENPDPEIAGEIAGEIDIEKEIDLLKMGKLQKLSSNIKLIGEIILQLKTENGKLITDFNFDCIENNQHIKDIYTELDLLSTTISAFINGVDEQLNLIKSKSDDSAANLKQLKLELDKINSEIESKLKQITQKIENPNNKKEYFIDKCKLSIQQNIESQVNQLVLFILNMSNMSVQLKTLVIDRIVYDYNFVIRSLDKIPDAQKQLKSLKASKPTPNIEKLLNELSLKQKMELIVSFLSDIKFKSFFDKGIGYKNIFGITTTSSTKLEKDFLMNLLLEHIKSESSSKTSIDILKFIYDNNIPSKLEPRITEKKLSGKLGEIKKLLSLVISFNMVGGFNNQNNNNKSNKLVQSQLGGFIKNWEDYYYQIIEMFIKLTKYKSLYNDFKAQAKKFNILYIQLYNHQLYISNYIQLVLLSEKYQVYEYASRGTVNFYRSITRNILEKCEDPKTVQTNSVIKYFYKYHYVTLKLLNSFLDELRTNWRTDFNFRNEDPIQKEKNKNLSRLVVIPSDPSIVHTDKMRKGLFIFNLFKDILDSYASTLSSPVAVYLRINDFSGQVGMNPNKLEIFKKDAERPERFIMDDLKKCSIDIPAVRQSTPLSEHGNLDSYIKKFERIEFNEIFDSAGFGENDVLAMYMGIPNYLSKGQSIMMITYGYSGVGKTFTLFGVNNPGNVRPGILQKALQSIQDKEQIFMRTYEIYGRALPYKSWWKDLKPEQYDHKIFKYTLDDNMGADVEELSGIEMLEYLRKIKENNSETYDIISDEQITKFDQFVGNIDDNHRVPSGRIKKTVNNPQSSRSIMVYEFKIKLTSGKYVRFVVMDLPGKEDIKSSYVYPNKSQAELKNEFCIGLKEDIMMDENGQRYYEPAVRASIFLNPIFISVFPKIAKKLVEFIKRNNKISREEMSQFKVSAISKDGIYTINNSLLNLIEKTSFDGTNLKQYFPISSSFNRNNSSASPVYKSKYEDCITAAELMRYLIEKNRIDIIIDFYEQELLDVGDNCNNPGALAYEGFYINENILGLVNTLRKRLNENFQIDKSTIMENFFSENMGVNQATKDGVPTNIYKDETIAQTYFLRNLMRQNINKKFMIGDDGTHLLVNKEGYDTEYSTKNTKKISSWLEDSYDFNKSYTEDPPIATFMNAYFDVLDDPIPEQSFKKNYVINNFYLFYVVNNENTNKCANQIKLISDSKNFIDAIKSYVPPKEN